MRNVRSGKLLYHLTKIDNLESILNLGLLSRRSLEDKNKKFKDITEKTAVESSKELELDKFVPFHFSPYTSFDNVDREKFSDNLIYICVDRECAKNKNFKIIPKKPINTDKIELMNFNAGMEEIEWKYMGKCYDCNDEITEIRGAECVTEDCVSMDSVFSIYVKDQETETRVMNVLKKKNKSEDIYVNIIPEFFTFDAKKY